MTDQDKPRIDFYILPDESRRSIHNFACRLAEKAYQQGHKILIKTESAAESQALDDLLWTIKENNFIPHGIYDASPDQQPILIHHGNDAVDGFQLLINLSSMANNQLQFNRIAEILNQESNCKQKGREHYKIYKDLGFEMHHHDMAAS